MLGEFCNVTFIMRMTDYWAVQRVLSAACMLCSVEYLDDYKGMSSLCPHDPTFQVAKDFILISSSVTRIQRQGCKRIHENTYVTLPMYVGVRMSYIHNCQLRHSFITSAHSHIANAFIEILS